MKYINFKNFTAVTAFSFFMVLLPGIKVAPAAACLHHLCIAWRGIIHQWERRKVPQQLCGARHISQQHKFKSYSRLAPTQKGACESISFARAIVQNFVFC